ncbi:hypothetical protein GCK32_019876 [Trichostrongylus colubriformis]|uniref:ZP domain-containing protein n=1 Tax=Trichostrongylus colubriformis TaxID=6319 RepID=A0AAN8I824_TRICO
MLADNDGCNFQVDDDASNPEHVPIAFRIDESLNTISSLCCDSKCGLRRCILLKDTTPSDPDPLTVSYEVTVIIQHHPLFITAGDRAYRLNCIYKQMASTLTQKINIKSRES